MRYACMFVAEVRNSWTTVTKPRASGGLLGRCARLADGGVMGPSSQTMRGKASEDRRGDCRGWKVARNRGAHAGKCAHLSDRAEAFCLRARARAWHGHT